jgi:hypothetical protein
MGKTLYNKLKEMLEGYEELSSDALGKLILEKIGSDKRTFERALFTLKNLNMIEEFGGHVRVKR